MPLPPIRLVPLSGSMDATGWLAEGAGLSQKVESRTRLEGRDDGEGTVEPYIKKVQAIAFLSFLPVTRMEQQQR